MKRFYTFSLAFLLTVPSLLFFTDLTRNPYAVQIALLNVMTVAIAILWLMQGIRQKSLALRRTPADFPLISFLVVAAVSWLTMFFVNAGEPYLRYGICNEGLQGWLFLLVNAFLPYYAAVYLVNDDNRSVLITAVFVTAWLAAAYGILQYFGVELVWPNVLNPFGGRCVSTFGNPNFLSSYLVMVLPVALVQWFARKSSVQRFFLGILIITCFMALLSTMTRSSWVGSVAAIVCVVILLMVFEKERFKMKRAALAFLGAILLALTVLWPRSDVGGSNTTFAERLTETAKAVGSSYQSYDQRRLIWSCAWHMVAENPVLGKGWGCFELFYPLYQGRHLFLPAYHPFRTHANNTHNEILEIWSQTGTAGLGIYLWLMAVLFRSAWSAIRRLSGNKRLLAIGLSAGAVGMLTDNLLNVSLHFAVPGFLYWWQWGILMGLGSLEVTVLRVQAPLKKTAVAILCVLAALAIARYYRGFMGEVHYFKGFKYSRNNDLQRAIAELEQAHALRRLDVNTNYELANCYARAGMRDESIELYKESLRANAGYDEIYFNMATVQAQTGAFAPSILEFTRSLYINPVSLEGYVALSSVFLKDPVAYARAGVALCTQGIYFFPDNQDMINNLQYFSAIANHHPAGKTNFSIRKKNTPPPL